jgi:DnaJ domain
MTTEECFQTLGIGSGASHEEIRRAYLDLAKVWHPDRFESDPHLRSLAEEHLRCINEAYQTLQHPQGRAHQPNRGNSATQAPRDTFRAEARRPRWKSSPFTIDSRTKPVLLAVGLLLSSVLLALAVVRILSLLRPALDLDLITSASHAVRPRVLEPMAAIDALSDVRVAVDSLTEWAHGEVLDLWSPVRHHFPARPLMAPSTPQVLIPAPAGPAKQSARRKVVIPQLENGAELVGTDSASGAGELHAVNNTAVEAIVSLTRNGLTVRAIYLCPNSAASVRDVQSGRYAVAVQLGNEIDVERLCFRHTLQSQRFGPFDFWEVVSSSGNSGQRYEVILKNR